jgi:hypothetical protein
VRQETAFSCRTGHIFEVYCINLASGAPNIREYMAHRDTAQHAFTYLGLRILALKNHFFFYEIQEIVNVLI